MDAAATVPLIDPKNVSQSGTYFIKSNVVNKCSSTEPVMVRVIVIQKVFGLRYPTIVTTPNTPVQLTARNLGVSYVWTPPVGLNFNTVINPVFNYNRNVEYNVNITTDSGCVIVDTIQLRITIEEAANPKSDLFVPKAWSPNGDGHNDKLFPLTVNIKQLKYFRIFNRWGQLVFETNAIGVGWDGTLRGVKQMTDIYTWTAEAVGANGATIKRSGNSVLIR
jgi:gliding motility-associated-like protein